jgi:hypothetical protein
VDHGTAGGARRRIAEAGAEARLEPVMAKDPEHILGDAGDGVAPRSGSGNGRKHRDRFIFRKSVSYFTQKFPHCARFSLTKEYTTSR